MPKHKKHHKARRNAATAPARSMEAARKAAEEDSRGWRTIKALGGAAATTVAGAYLARQDVLPPKIMTGAISALGAALALGAPNRTIRSIGLGAMAAAGGQLGFMLIDDELIRREEKKKEDRPQLAGGPRPSTPPTPGKKPSNASDIPADALAR